METKEGQDAAVWKRRVEAAAELLADVGAGECGRLDILTRIRVLKEQVEQLRTAIGANEGEGTIEALHRYTFAVQFGCALKIEREVRGVKGNPHLVSAFKSAAAFLREGLPVAVSSEAAPRNAVEIWKAEQTQAIRDGWIDEVFERFWSEVLGDIPSNAAKERFRTLLEEYEPE